MFASPCNTPSTLTVSSTRPMPRRISLMCLY
jgi:hypothetical protein